MAGIKDYDQDAAFQKAAERIGYGQDAPSYAGTFEGKLNDIYDRIANREKFSYDVNADPLYQSYKDQYIQGGKLAMKDTMGQAAALTGGYGNTYGQQVGQQAYNAYLKNLSAVIPELYGMAYDQYRDEGDDLKDLYSMMGARRDREYNEYRDRMSDYNTERSLVRSQEESDYERALALDALDYDRQLTADNTAYSRQQDSYQNLVSLIMNSGYVPTDDELAAAGLTRDAANALAAEYQRSIGGAVAGGGGGGGSPVGASGGSSRGGSGGGSSAVRAAAYGTGGPYDTSGTIPDWAVSGGSPSGSDQGYDPGVASLQEALRQEGYNIDVTGTPTLATRTAAESYVNRDNSAHWSTVNDRSAASSGTQYDWRGIPITYSPDKVQSEASSSGIATGAAGGSASSAGAPENTKNIFQKALDKVSSLFN